MEDVELIAACLPRWFNRNLLILKKWDSKKASINEERCWPVFNFRFVLEVPVSTYDKMRCWERKLALSVYP